MCIVTKNNPKDLCSVCHKNVNNNHKAILWSNCLSWSHIKCNNVDVKNYVFHQNNPSELFYCLSCKEDILPFTKLNDYQFENLITRAIIESYDIKFKPSSAHRQQLINRIGILNHIIKILLMNLKPSMTNQ